MQAPGGFRRGTDTRACKTTRVQGAGCSGPLLLWSSLTGPSLHPSPTFTHPPQTDSCTFCVEFVWSLCSCVRGDEAEGRCSHHTEWSEQRLQMWLNKVPRAWRPLNSPLSTESVGLDTSGVDIETRGLCTEIPGVGTEKKINQIITKSVSLLKRLYYPT